MNGCFTKEESERIELLVQLQIELVPVKWLKRLLIDTKKYNYKKAKMKRKNGKDGV